MAVYKGKYSQESNSRYTVDLYEDSTKKTTVSGFLDEADAKAEIIAWVAQEGGNKPDITSDDFTPDMDNFNSLYLYSG